MYSGRWNRPTMRNRWWTEWTCGSSSLLSWGFEEVQLHQLQFFDLFEAETKGEVLPQVRFAHQRLCIIGQLRCPPNSWLRITPYYWMSAFCQISCRGVSHTPECTHLSTWMFAGRMRYAPTLALCGYSLYIIWMGVQLHICLVNKPKAGTFIPF